ncbi:MAG TPA: ribonuclease J [Fastidiosipila sp.]|nr:ribonuclease J [Fastidiosipila sp.]
MAKRKQGDHRSGEHHSKDLKIIPLGGMREVGKNLTIYEYEDTLIVVDCGIGFPEEDMPGVDVIIPDFTYLRENQAKFKAVILTHGHEDHIGAMPYLLKEFQVPVYGNRLTLKLLEIKLSDRGTQVKNADLRLVTDGMKVGIGQLSVEFIPVNHSIADANALAIETPLGVVIHSGDFKVDFTPLSGEVIDLNRLAHFGTQGVLALISESTNIDIPGTTKSERAIGDTFRQMFSTVEGRIFVATFSSNVSRLQQIITAAEQNGRKVVLVGRSMLNMFKAANELGYLEIEEGTMAELHQADQLADDKVVFIATGSQGEPMSALSRIAFASHRELEIKDGDTVIFSSSMIPGNETKIHRVINELVKQGAKVIYESLADVHVSGHGYRDELKLLLALTKPTFFVPAHGEYRMLHEHAQVAQAMGVDPERTAILSNGDILAINHNRQQVIGFTSGQGIPIDGSGMGDIDEDVLNDRRLLADDGVVVAFIAVDQKKNEIATTPDIQARGFIYESEIQDVVQSCLERIRQVADKAKQSDRDIATALKGNELRNSLRNLLFERTRRRPIILISVIEV